MHPPSEHEQPPADRPAAHPVTAPEASVASSLSLSPTHDDDCNRSQAQNLSMQMHSGAASEPASDSDSGSDPFYGLQAETGEPTSPTAPLAPFPPLPPPEARSRAPEFYGFVAWTSTYLLFVLYLLWAFLPDAAILALGVTWYPNREWSLLIPAYGMVLVLLTYFTYFALALAGTPPFADMRTITDSKAHLPASPSDGDAELDANVHGHGGDIDAGSDSASDMNVHQDDDAPIAPEPQPGSRSDDAAHPPSLFNASSPLNPNPKRRPQAHLKPESNLSTPKSTPNSQPTNPYLAYARPDAIPELYDIPLGMVNRVIYGPRRARTQS